MAEGPKDLAQWKDEAANAALFRVKAGDAGGEARRLLEYGPTNRIVTADEARYLLCLRLQAKRLGFVWLTEWCNDVERYQLTIGAPVNSRKSFLEALTAEMRAAAARAQGVFGRMFGGVGSGTQ